MHAVRRSVFVGFLLAPVCAVTAAAIAAEIVIEEKITYRSVEGEELQLDLARPDGEGPYPAIVFIHGGGWRGGNRAAYRREIEEAARRGYVAVTASYRLTQPDEQRKAKYPFPAQVHDVKCAIRWLRANAGKYRVDPDRIGVTGGSAGGHLSLMLGVTDESAGLEGEGCHSEQSSRVQAVVNVFGPTDMLHLHETSEGAAPIVASFLGGEPGEAEKAYRDASPITYVDSGDPPILTIHGTADTLVPPDQAERFDAAVKKAGADHELLLLEKQGHGFRGEAVGEAQRAMYAFFDRHLK